MQQNNLRMTVELALNIARGHAPEIDLIKAADTHAEVADIRGWLGSTPEALLDAARRAAAPHLSTLLGGDAPFWEVYLELDPVVGFDQDAAPEFATTAPVTTIPAAPTPDEPPRQMADLEWIERHLPEVREYLGQPSNRDLLKAIGMRDDRKETTREETYFSQLARGLGHKTSAEFIRNVRVGLERLMLLKDVPTEKLAAAKALLPLMTEIEGLLAQIHEAAVGNILSARAYLRELKMPETAEYEGYFETFRGREPDGWREKDGKLVLCAPPAFLHELHKAALQRLDELTRPAEAPKPAVSVLPPPRPGAAPVTPVREEEDNPFRTTRINTAPTSRKGRLRYIREQLAEKGEVSINELSVDLGLGNVGHVSGLMKHVNARHVGNGVYKRVS